MSSGPWNPPSPEIRAPPPPLKVFTSTGSGAKRFLRLRSQPEGSSSPKARKSLRGRRQKIRIMMGKVTERDEASYILRDVHCPLNILIFSLKLSILVYLESHYFLNFFTENIPFTV